MQKRTTKARKGLLRWLDQVEEDLKKMKVRNLRENWIVEQNRKAGQNPPRVVAPTEEEERFLET